MRRRKFIGLVSAAAVSPLAARAQQPSIPVIGFLNLRRREEGHQLIGAFKQGLQEQRYIDGQNVSVVERWAEGDATRLPSLVADLLTRNPAAIFTSGNVALKVVSAIGTTLPVIFSIATDPVRMGYVATLSRPGGNLTGVSIFGVSLGAKQVELLCQLSDKRLPVGVLINPSNPTAELHLQDMRTAARNLDREIVVIEAATEADISRGLATLVRRGIGGVIIDDDAFFNSHRVRLVTLASQNRIPAMYSNREFPEAGGLMSYGINLADSVRQGGGYVGRVLRGESPADLPVIQPTKFEFVINTKTAKSLGIEFLPTFLTRADEVIE